MNARITIEEDSTFEITTSLRWNNISPTPASITPDSVPQLDGIPLSYHRDRLLGAAIAFVWPFTIELLQGDKGLKTLLTAILETTTTLAENSTFKLRINISRHATLSIQPSDPITNFYPFTLPHTPLTLLSHNFPTPLPDVALYPYPSPTDLHTAHKTTLRKPYNYIASTLPAELQNIPPTTAEVLLQNAKGEVTESLYSTPYFLRDGRLITPHASCGGNRGVTRRLALTEGWAEQGVVDMRSVSIGERVVLSNAVRGFWVAEFRGPLLPDRASGREGELRFMDDSDQNQMEVRRLMREIEVMSKREEGCTEEEVNRVRWELDRILEKTKRREEELDRQEEALRREIRSGLGEEANQRAEARKRELEGIRSEPGWGE
jgi:hypothetical protein